MIVGFFVDFSVYICYVYFVVDVDDRVMKVDFFLDWLGGLIFNVVFLIFLGVLILGFVNSYIFKIFGKMMFLVIFFGFVYLVFLILIVLLFIGLLKVRKVKFDEKVWLECENFKFSLSLIWIIFFSSVIIYVYLY